MVKLSKCGFNMTMNKIPVITIDGPSGVGKGAISQLLANSLHWHFLDSGAIYRALALVVIEHKLAMDDQRMLADIGRGLDVEFITSVGLPQKIMLNGKDVSLAIRAEECAGIASKIAALPEVRMALIECQRSFCRLPGLVADGRDMGTVVFPDAKLKLFLTADLEERAKRRLLQLQDQNINATLDTVLGDLASRDKRDSARVIAPLKPDSAAVIIDTTKLSIDEVLQQVLAHVKGMQL